MSAAVGSSQANQDQNTMIDEGGVTVRVTFTNTSPENGVFLTPPWVGFHDGGFDSYDGGAPTSPELERMAEDGNPGPLSQAFLDLGAGAIDGVLDGEGPIGPGVSVSKEFHLNPASPMSRYLSYASMVIPSNDAYVANGNPMAHAIFDESGRFQALDFAILGSEINDAGTEVNDELPESTAFFGQSVPDSGVDENGVNRDHPGFLAPGEGGVLDDPRFAEADFTEAGYQIARVRVERVTPSEMVDVTVTLVNDAPEGGVFLTPVWLGFHDGTFDLFDAGSPVSPALERLAEDGNTAVLSEAFFSETGAGFDATVASGMGIPPFGPGESATVRFSLDPSNPAHRYLSFASMVIPSNDAFIGNGNPTAYPLFDEVGNFIGSSVIRLGSQVYDAGSEVNDESPSSTAFFGQETPDTGESEGGVIRTHEGFNPVGSGGIRDAAEFANADFTAAPYPLFGLELGETFRVTSSGFQNGEVTLSWRGGRAPYQVQWSEDLVAWQDLGGSTEDMTMTITSNEAAAYFRVVEIETTAASTAIYELTFNATWSAATHPTDFPTGRPHFSGLIGATHGGGTSLWDPGAMATEGIEVMAETGGKSPLMTEIDALIAEGLAETLVSGGGISRSPGQVSVQFEASQEHPLVSVVSMIAPSPDWFVGVHGLALFQDGRWEDELVVSLDPYDAGTDNGVTYASPDNDTQPQEPIVRLTFPFDVDGVVAPLGTFTFRRLDP